MEPKLLSDLVTRMRKWKYKMLSRDAKIQALDDSFTQSYGMPPTLFLSRRLLRKKLTSSREHSYGAAPIGLHQLYPPKVAGGLELQSVEVNAKQMWAKEFLDSVSTEFFNTSSLRMWMLSHKSLHTKATCPPFRREACEPCAKENGQYGQESYPRTTEPKLQPLTPSTATHPTISKKEEYQ
ncbi:hypothetical protein DSO57_1003406 [Entomophthora muscae]|uniref:Uncharacterized protein n=1 Tax=Entomophthora muscae TaxID=34485 RepID=A0ACC2TJH6_9FUNG|nr:hypothetical protein DSO57_1003406 [Entomophthora muscae]